MRIWQQRSKTKRFVAQRLIPSYNTSRDRNVMSPVPSGVRFNLRLFFASEAVTIKYCKRWREP